MTGLSLRHERHPFSLMLSFHSQLSGVHICDPFHTTLLSPIEPHKRLELLEGTGDFK